MAKFLAVQIRLGKITLEQVPEHLRVAVEIELNKVQEVT